MRLREVALLVLGAVGLTVIPISYVAAQTAGRLSGRTLETTTSAAVSTVDVELLDTRRRRVASTTSDSSGHFHFDNQPAGPYQLRARSIGHRTVTSPLFELVADEAMNVVLWLSVDAVPLAPLEIVARATPTHTNSALAGFYARANRHNGGHFILREEIGLRNQRLVSDLLITSGVYVVGEGLYMRRTGCAPTIFLDGIVLDRSRWPEYAYEAVNTVHPSDIEGIEVHTAATVPAEFGGSIAGCGVILLWTTRGPSR